MRLVKDNSPDAWAVEVPCIGPNHYLGVPPGGRHLTTTRMFTLAQGYIDLDSEALMGYYCDACAERLQEGGQA